MNIRKNRSGNWEIRQMIDGKTYQKTIKGKKPTEYEAMQIIMAMVDSEKKPDSISFQDGAHEYIKSRMNVVSPATIREYTRKIDRLPSWFTQKDIYGIDQTDMQRLVNEMSADHKSKTIHDVHGFCVGVIRFFIPQVVFNTTFKQNDRTERYMPSEQEVEAILKQAEGTEYHIVLQLACYSLRRSELCAVLKSDLTEDNQIHVCKAKVQDVNKQWVIKVPKTEDSDRYVPIDDALADEIRSLDREEIYPYAPQNISNFLRRTQTRLNMPLFSVHCLRHYYASKLHMAGVDDITIQKTGGWKNNSVLKSSYTHSDIGVNPTKQNLIRNIFKRKKNTDQ